MTAAAPDPVQADEPTFDVDAALRRADLARLNSMRCQWSQLPASITHWGAGSTESGNTFAQEWLASGGQAPSQWLLFQGPRGMAAEHLLRLDEVDIPTPTHQDVNA